MQLRKRTANVLGTNYTIEFKSEQEDKQLEELGGYCDSTIKSIIICKITPSLHTVKDLAVYYNDIILHELIHAFISESSARREVWDEEDICCYMSSMLPKIYETYNKIKL